MQLRPGPEFHSRPNMATYFNMEIYWTSLAIFPREVYLKTVQLFIIHVHNITYYMEIYWTSLAIFLRQLYLKTVQLFIIHVHNITYYTSLFSPNKPACYEVTNGVFTPEQDKDKTRTRQMLNLCIPMMPFTPGPTCLV